MITEDVPPYAVVVGHPGRVLRYLEADDDEEARTAVLHEFGLALPLAGHFITNTNSLYKSFRSRSLLAQARRQ